MDEELDYLGFRRFNTLGVYPDKGRTISFGRKSQKDAASIVNAL
jgi:hypothetical protein